MAVICRSSVMARGSEEDRAAVEAVLAAADYYAVLGAPREVRRLARAGAGFA